LDNTNLLVGLDIGTTSVKAVVADAGKVIGAVAVPNKGMFVHKRLSIRQQSKRITKLLKQE